MPSGREAGMGPLTSVRGGGGEGRGGVPIDPVRDAAGS
jgi:hypothetical protein